MARKPTDITNRDHYPGRASGRLPPAKPESPHRFDPSVRGGTYSWCLWSLGSSRRSFAPETGKGRIRKLKRLNNNRYHDGPVSLYGGMVDLPLIVTRPDEVSWFRDRDLLTDGQLWAEREPELNAFLLPALRTVCAGKPEADRSVLLDGRTLDLGQPLPRRSLGAMLALLKKKPVLERGVRRAFSTADAGWILGELSHALRRIVESRNPAAYGKKTSKDEASARRAEVMGIGRMGGGGMRGSQETCRSNARGKEKNRGLFAFFQAVTTLRIPPLRVKRL